jgi:NADP-dependent 3-hydroxy acid dehydrogenase YdfG
MPKQKLDGKTAIVTGASAGIGWATALALGAQGARVVITARRKKRLTDLESELRANGVDAIVIEADMAEESDVRRLIVEAGKRCGRIDILINNAGVMLNSPVARANIADWKRMLDVNVFGLMVASQAVLPVMKAQGGGHIVNISSVAARIAGTTASAYSASKAAVNVFSEALRKEVYRDNIRVTVVAPGVVETELRDHIPDPATRTEADKYARSMRALQAEDVAAAIIYAVTQPIHVGINEIVIRPVDQER